MISPPGLRSRGLAALLLLLALTPRSALGSPPATETTPAAATHCHLLDPEQRYPKRGQIALDAFGGSFLGASVGSSYAAGGRVMVFITRLLGLGLSYTSSRLAAGHDLGQVQDRAIHLLNGQLELGVDTTVRISAKTVLEIDLFGTFGGGAVRLADEWKGMGVIGGGVRVYTGLSWLAVRIDVTNFLQGVPRADGRRFESNAAFTLGLSLHLPPRAVPRQR